MDDKKNPDLNTVEWPKDAENYTFEPKQRSCEKGKHKFKYTNKANYVKCDCGVGYQLASGMEVEPDGHIYYNGDFVI